MCAQKGGEVNRLNLENLQTFTETQKARNEIQGSLV